MSFKSGSKPLLVLTFIPLKPFASWVLNETTCNWEAPVTYPTDGKQYNWNEKTTSWVEVTGYGE